MNFNEELTQERLKEFLKYDYETGLFYRIKTKRKALLTVKAGCLNTRGYIQIRVCGKKRQAHHLVWLYHYGNLPKEQIDHIDGNRSNNRLENIREVSNAENAKNKCKQSNNTSGTVGVKIQKDKKPDGEIYEKWVAIWQDPSSGKQRLKSFAVNKYGFFEAKELATLFRATKIQELNLLGAGYTARHGI